MADKRTGNASARPRARASAGARPAAAKSALGLVPPARGADKAAAAPERPRSPRPRFRLTRRATILLLAVCAVVVTIAYPLQEYLAQRSQLAAIDAQNAALSSKVTALQRQIALWHDPGYVAIQARAQLHYVLPGEEGFTLPGTTIGSEQLGMPTPVASPWYDTLWGTVKSPGAAGSASPSAGR
jgi:cell division protein FtsB